MFHPLMHNFHAIFAKFPDFCKQTGKNLTKSRPCQAHANTASVRRLLRARSQPTSFVLEAGGEYAPQRGRKQAPALSPALPSRREQIPH